MSNTLSGEGVQVLFVEENGTYRVDEAALRRVTQHKAAHGLPVAVVSVAGATRGGKSFLLDFFLRYLRAPKAARDSGAWLGGDDEPLTGFTWRGGCERDTQGILIWSEPIIVTVGSKGHRKKVAVVLMDTQGTFDTSSTVRDSSTIFAMSTLLSSVQIYNLSQNIKEDDLEYLQLFTEYGKLARDEEVESPFQVLQFLVRDWSYAYEHPLGAEGGQQLLDKRLEIRSEQAEELREIRQHVRSAFESVRCCLLPHPGLTVATSPRFRGCLADISSEFKSALVELVPSLFAPENLTLKTVNGQRITIEDLADYFVSYIGIFNSDVLPTPTTVMQATSRASLEAALRASREEYCSYMERCLEGARSVRRAALPCVHAAAMDAARATFAARKTLAAPALTASRLASLLQELDAMLHNYVALNHAKILEAIAVSKVAYEEAMDESETCLSGATLTARHEALLEAARAAFDASRGGSPDDDDDAEDEDWRTLEKELQDLLPLHRERNSKRIEHESERAREAYSASMREALAVAACVHPAALRRVHGSARGASLVGFRDKWSEESTDREEHEAALRTYIDMKYQEFNNENEENNELALEETLDFYDTRMSEFFDGLGWKCLHPQDLAAQHDRVKEAAIAHFMNKRAPLPFQFRDDPHKKSLTTSTGLPQRFIKFEERNEALNKDVVKSAHEYYTSRITPLRVGGDGLLELLGPPDFSVFNRHEPIAREALQHFRSKRFNGPDYDDDTHRDDLKKEIAKTFGWLSLKVLGSCAVNVASVASLIFAFRR